jgi:hypothetical protein
MDIDRYRQGAEHCANRAHDVKIHEIEQLWQSIERSYRFLLEREERIARATSDALAGR